MWLKIGACELEPLVEECWSQALLTRDAVYKSRSAAEELKEWSYIDALSCKFGVYALSSLLCHQAKAYYKTLHEGKCMLLDHVQFWSDMAQAPGHQLTATFRQKHYNSRL